MKLNTREGAGDRIAVLVHGILSDSRTWRRVGPAPAPAGRGYRVVAVDPRGHGASGRTDEYPNEAYGADISETIGAPDGVDLAIGHSLGGRAVLLAVEAGLRPAKAVYVDPARRLLPAVEAGLRPAKAVYVDPARRLLPAVEAGLRPAKAVYVDPARRLLPAVEAGLRPAKAVYVDPARRLSRPADGFDPAAFVEFADHATYEAIAAWAPRWETDDIEIELATLAVWDRRTALESSRYAVAALDAGTAGDGTGLPSRAEVPSLITLAEQSRMTDTQDAETLRRRGFELRTVPGAGHSIHRDDLEGFMTALEASL
jgi:pimeloyl-ACP methyl ester carboxylesterase